MINKSRSTEKCMGSGPAFLQKVTRQETTPKTAGQLKTPPATFNCLFSLSFPYTTKV